jgi:hypothetical protein
MLSSRKDFKTKLTLMSYSYDETDAIIDESQFDYRKRYYVKVRAYVLVNGVKVYGNWSNTISIKYYEDGCQD